MLPVIKGSEVLVSVEPFFEFASADNDNSMLGFGWFKNGFSLENNSTTCIFDSVYPVSGSVSLNGGTLTLEQDLILKKTTHLQSLGTILGGSHILDLGNTTTFLTADYNGVFEDVTLLFNRDLIIAGTLTFTGNCIFSGYGNALTLEDSAELIVDSNAHLVLTDMTIKKINGSNIRCIDDTGQITLDNLIWEQSDDFIFSNGSLYLLNYLDFVGAKKFTYESSETSTIASNATWRMLRGTTLEIGRQELDGPQPLYFEDDSAKMNLNGCTFSITATGMQLARGKVIVSKDVDIYISSLTTTYGLQLGDGAIDNDITLELHPGASLTFNSGHVNYNLANPSAITSRAKTSRMIRKTGSMYTLHTDAIFKDLTLEQEAGTIVSVDSYANITYEEAQLKIPNVGQFIFTGKRYNATTNLLDGNGSIVMLNGVLPVSTLVSGSGNSFSGTGNVVGVTTLQDSGAILTVALNGVFITPIILNSGTLIAGSHITLSGGTVITGPGTVNLGSNHLFLGAQELIWPTNITFVCNNAVIDLNAKLTLTSAWTVQGTCTIDGHGNTLDLDSTGEIVIAVGSTLILKNVRLENISGTNIRCLGSDSVIILDQINWLQSSDYVFATGAFQSKNKVTMQGSASFAYQTDQTSTIMKESILKLDKGFTFSYDPTLSVDLDLLEFIDNSSHLILNSASLCATLTGMNLQKGSLFVRGNSIMCSEIETISPIESINIGISFGDNSNANNDFVCEIAASAELKVTQGALNYQNLKSASLNMLNTLSSLTMDANTTLRLYQDIFVSPGRIITSNNTTLKKASGTNIIGSLVPQGKLIKRRL